MSSSGGIAVDKDYIKSPLGIIHIVEMVLSLITFICAMVWLAGYGAQWVQFVAIMGFLIALAMFIMHLLNILSKIPASVPWALIEFIISAVWTVLFLIAGIVAAVAASRGSFFLYPRGYVPSSSVIASAVFCFLTLIAWAIGTFLLFRIWRSGGAEVKTTTSTNVETPPPAAT